MTIGFIGLGLMGTPMAERLQKAGYQLAVYNRTKEKAATLLSKGAEWCSTPTAVAERCEMVFSMLSTPQVLEDAARQVLSGLKPGGIHLDSSTVSPELTKRLEAEYRKKNCTFLHAPVLGSVPQVVDGSLLFFVGGDETAFKKVEPMLKAIGSKIWRFDRVEQATTTKLICNSFIAGMIAVLGQALTFAKKVDIDPARIVEIIGHSAMRAPMYETKGASVIARNFTPRFFTEHMFKDINLFVEAGTAAGVPLPVAELAQELFSKAMAKGYGKEDYSAVVKVMEELAGV